MSRQAEINRRQQLRQQQFEAAKAKQRQRRIYIGGGIGVGVLILALVIWAIVGGSNAPSAGQVTPPNATAEKNGIVVNPGKAADSAPLVEEFQDYQCPYCAQFNSVFGKRLSELAEKGAIRLVFRTMTFLDTNLRNDSSERAAIGASCADTVGAYKGYHDAIYANQPTKEGDGYSDQQLRVDFASQAKITGDNLTKFQACYDSRATKDFVKGVNEGAFKSGVTGTPTYWLNGTDITKQLNPNDAFSLDRALGTVGK